MENANDNNQGYASILDEPNDVAPAGPAPEPTPTPAPTPAPDTEPATAPVESAQPIVETQPAAEPQPTQYQPLTQTSVAPAPAAANDVSFFLTSFSHRS